MELAASVSYVARSTGLSICDPGSLPALSLRIVSPPTPLLLPFFEPRRYVTLGFPNAPAPFPVPHPPKFNHKVPSEFKH